MVDKEEDNSSTVRGWTQSDSVNCCVNEQVACKDSI